MLALIAGIILFFAIHLVPQRQTLKNALVERIGMMGYRALHGIVALAAVALIFGGYFVARYDVVLWYPPVWTRHLAATLMLFASILLFAAPFKGKIKEKLTSPLSVAIKVWALAHLMANGTLADVILFGFFLFYAVTYRISLKKRIQAGLVVVPEGRWLNDVYAVVLGLGFYAVMVLWLHEWAFDVAPLG
ncbi:NnrU family protein [Cohaesibacter intestini]|uniref:NnrU family protein n=1 Tax=Cohaesibacter intestini TaxID=2211145 RepID=UPI000DE9B92E|nr:NnrU family protein [Cohaesibacter intestini]